MPELSANNFPGMYVFIVGAVMLIAAISVTMGYSAVRFIIRTARKKWGRHDQQ